ncbi:MAG: sugar transferase [Candidatus Sungbacteria bacterium]|nr:sugar transferase [Candidatus Sungbacteria bacterium]
MKRQTKKILFLMICDLLLLYGALGFTLALRYGANPDRQLILQHILPFTILFLIWLIFFGAFGFYDLRFAKNSKYFLYRLAQVMVINAVIGVLFFYLLSFNIEPRRNLLLIATFALIFIFCWRSLLNLLIVRTGATRVLFIGMSAEAIKLADYLLAHPQLGQRPVAFLSAHSVSPQDRLGLPAYNTEDDLALIIRTHSVNSIVMLPEIKENRTLVKLLFQIIPLGIPVFEFSTYYETLIGKIPASFVGEVWFLENLIGIRKHFYEFFKRMLDMLLAIVAGMIVVLCFPFVALGMILSTPQDILNYKERRARPGDGIIFFRQPRVGKNGRVFSFVKFRSQRLGAERISRQINEAKEMTDDPRQYWFGKLMRKTYFDELPQLWNVLKGEMSFIGPRPERPEYVEKLKQKVPFYEMRLLVPPGITGWAQTKMENDAAVEDAPEKMQYDLYYIKNRSFTLDLLIILRTIYILLQRQGR